MPASTAHADGPYPIRTVAELTGVNPVTLRAWERRYGVVQPARTPKGHRLYSRQDVEQINHILAELAQGTSIGRVAERLQGQTNPGSALEQFWDGARTRMVDAVSRFDETVLDTIYDEAMSLYPVDIVTSQLLIPLLRQLGERWDTTEGGVAEEHFFSVFMRNKLGARFHHRNRRISGPVLVAACLPGEHHEFGLLLFALAAHDRGLRIVLLGADTPVDQLLHVVERISARGIVVSASEQIDASRFRDQIRKLSTSGVPIFVGGSFSHGNSESIRAAGAIPLPQELGHSLQTVRKSLELSGSIRRP